MHMKLYVGIKFVIALLLMLISIVIVEIVLVSVFSQGLPGNIELTLLNNFSFYMDLSASNPASAAELMLSKNAVFTIQRLDATGSNQIWGLYIMPVSLAMQLAVSFLLVLACKLKLPFRSWLWMLTASTVLLGSVFYLRLQVCCTSGSAWLINTLLLTRVYNPSLDTVFWQTIYIQVAPWLPLIQFFAATVSLLIMAACFSMHDYNRKNL